MASADADVKAGATEHWLMKFTSKERGFLTERPRVYRFGDGKEWTIATNGHIAVSLAGRVDGFEDAEECHANLIQKLIVKISAPTTSMTVSLAELKAWLGDAAWPTESECYECYGGEIECPHCGQDMKCETCGGTSVSVEEPEAREGWIADAFIDRVKLAQAMSFLSGDTVEVCAFLEKGASYSSILHVDDAAGGWSIFMVALDPKRHPGTSKAFPRFPNLE